MSTSALESQGMTIAISDDASPEVFTTIPEVSDISGPDGSASEINVTDLASTAQEFKVGLKDEGSVSITMNYIPQNAVHTTLRTARNNRTLKNFRISFTDSPQTTWTFNAYVITFPIANGLDGVTTSTVGLRVSGSITEA